MAEKIWIRYGASAAGKTEIYEIPEILACDPRNAESILGIGAETKHAKVLPFRTKSA